jgi:hypothetical protein
MFPSPIPPPNRILSRPNAEMVRFPFMRDKLENMAAFTDFLFYDFMT